MSMLNAPGPVLPALPTYAPIEMQCGEDDWVYVVARWPDLSIREHFVWHVGDAYWTEVVLH
jgi:hypothetical protein